MLSSSEVHVTLTACKALATVALIIYCKGETQYLKNQDIPKLSIHPMPKTYKTRKWLKYTCKNQSQGKHQGCNHCRCRCVGRLQLVRKMTDITNEQINWAKVLAKSCQTIKKSHWNAARAAGTVTFIQNPMIR
jgi:hypothetical protein